MSNNFNRFETKFEDSKDIAPEVLKHSKDFTLEDQLQAAYDVIGELQAELAGVKAAWLKQDLENYYKDKPKPDDTFVTHQFRREANLNTSTNARESVGKKTVSTSEIDRRYRNDRDDTSFVSSAWASSIYDSSPSSSSSSSCDSSSSSSSCDSGSSSSCD